MHTFRFTDFQTNCTGKKTAHQHGTDAAQNDVEALGQQASALERRVLHIFDKSLHQHSPSTVAAAQQRLRNAQHWDAIGLPVPGTEQCRLPLAPLLAVAAPCACETNKPPPAPEGAAGTPSQPLQPPAHCRRPNALTTGPVRADQRLIPRSADAPSPADQESSHPLNFSARHLCCARHAM